MWIHNATPEFRSHAKPREGSKTIKGFDLSEIRATYHHLNLITGYNRKTNEIAISDSWGNEYKESWVPLEEANKASKEQLYVIGY